MYLCICVYVCIFSICMHWFCTNICVCVYIVSIFVVMYLYAYCYTMILEKKIYESYMYF